jgi:hypothetical protein
MRYVGLNLIAILLMLTVAESQSQEWQTLFDGKSLTGWRAGGNVKSFKVRDGAIVCHGPVGHLYYVGPDGKASFKNFEFVVEVKAAAHSNSGIYFHTAYQETGWPEKGYEAQVINSHFKTKDGYMERKMTGSLYAIRNVYKSPVNDNEWFSYRILVQGKTIRIYINDGLISDYTEAENPWRSGGIQQRLLSSGTFALQAHDPDSKVLFRHIKVKRLAADLPSPGTALADADLDRRLTELATSNFPLIDLHVHLKGELSLEKALAFSRLYGITYGLALNCGLKFPIANDESLANYLASYKKPPQTFLAMQAEGREWSGLFSEQARKKFDYVFTDAMTWTNKIGKRMRLWVKEECEIGDKQDFMDQLTGQIEKIFSTEPVQIYVNPTYVPGELDPEYDALWTTERIDRIINTLVKNKVALEINARRCAPSPTFIKRAKAAGVKFTFGTNNAGLDDLGHLDYCLRMIQECHLQPDDMWMPE